MRGRGYELLLLIATGQLRNQKAVIEPSRLVAKNSDCDFFGDGWPGLVQANHPRTKTPGQGGGAWV